MADVVALQNGVKQLKQMEQCSTDCAKMNDALTQLKIALVQLDQSNVQVRAAACAMYQTACLLSVRAGDSEAFVRHFRQFEQYDCASNDEERDVVFALFLLFLLKENDAAAFHVFLERVQQRGELVSRVVQLEQLLADGGYADMLRKAQDLPQTYFGSFANTLMHTVREKAADCAEVAYESLSVEAAKSLLWFAQTDELHAFAQARNWRLEGGCYRFALTDLNTRPDASGSAHDAIRYAVEIERIV
ncbi:MAG: hypothetical protein MHM6MM_005609 [Cercozoa sp. M6MM]